MSNQQERELGWDDTIQKDGGGDFVVLPSGEYNFTVKKFERGRFAGSEKMPACNQAKLELAVHSPEHGDVTISHTLLLHTKTEGFLSNFFAGIGQKRKGEPLRMNWNAVTGARGRLKLGIRTYKDKEGQERQGNEVKTFIAAEEVHPGAQQQPPFPPAQQGGNWNVGQQGGNWNAGQQNGNWNAGQQGGGWNAGQF
ncbi:hypothetical protein [Cohnella thailandensis]|uniref:DUF669 domain-containing protein n=1 Tax=Cohnella thailandensis TaxID=557557 RepID=A0A841SQA8_9BACL|nr:hypothetical protein [Cohnella thailandensis]MBB6632786.1 hypothetical protein [Cohnella thailandensis]MBP1975523.1 hypothetical protein [Cohnella thailandensis]